MKKFTAIFLICQIVLLLAFPALASVATPADADILEEFEFATSSDAVSMFDSLKQYSNISLMASGEVEEVQTTIAQPTKIKVVYRYRDKNSKQHEISTYLNSKGYFSFPTPPSDLGSSYELLFWFTDTKPPSGKYLMKFSLSSDTGGHSFSSATLWSQKLYSNSASLTDGKGIPITQYSGDVSGSATVDIGSVGPICINLRVQDLIPPCGGYFNLRFERLKDQSVSTDITTVGGSYSSGDAAADTAQSSAQIAQYTADMNDTLKEIVQTISNQLAALWDQMYNLMHLRQLANDDKNTQAIINSQKQTTNQIIENNNENTQEVTGAIEQHGNFIIEGLKSLFIPSDDYFKAYFDDLYGWFSTKFGFFTIPLDIFIQIVGVFTSSDQTDFVLILPGFSIMDEQVWADQTFNLTEFLNENFAFILSPIHWVTDIALAMAFVELCRKKYDEVMRN